MNWPLIAPYFDPDGSLRDLYIEDTTEADWTKVWQFLEARTPPPIFKIGGDDAPMPPDAEAAWVVARDHSTAVIFRCGLIEVVLHFFTIDEIELDIDPADINGPEEADLLATLMGELGDVTGKPVLLTQEMSKDRLIARYDPASKLMMWWHALG